MTQSWQLVTPWGDLPPVERLRRDQDPRIADFHACPYRLRTESRKQRPEHAAVLQRAERHDVQFRNPPEQAEDAVALADAKALQHIREAVRQLRQIAVAEVADIAVLAKPAHRQMIAPAMAHVPVDGFISDIETAAGQTVELIPRRIPCEAGPDLLVIPKVGHDTLFTRRLVDRFPRHGGTSPLMRGRHPTVNSCSR